MNLLDYLVLVGVIVGIAAYGIWRTRGPRNLRAYLKGDETMGWGAVGLSVMATQASAITFMSTPGQGFRDGLGFVQNYFGLPLALIFICIVFLPIYRRLNVYTSYEYLGRRFDTKTRLLGAVLFLIQRGLGAGITIYAPAIVLSTVMGWRLDYTILCSGLVAIVYTVSGGTEAVSITQRYQMGIIFVGMVAAFVILMVKISNNVSINDALHLAGAFNKMQAVDFSLDVKKRYTFWSGVFGGLFLALSYFGTDQSQVQRYITGKSLRESRLGLMFNAVCKIPMQFFILLLGAMMFIFYQFERPPVFFNETAWKYQSEHGSGEQLRALEQKFAVAYDAKLQKIHAWLDARRSGNSALEKEARAAAVAELDHTEAIRKEANTVIDKAKPHTSDTEADYVFITFILDHLPHGLIGLLVAVFFAAALSAKASELNALGSTTTVDIYRHIVKNPASEVHYVIASRCFTAFWGLVALAFALSVRLAENLIQAVNILGSVFYGVVLGLFMVAFFLKRVGGTAVFWSAIAAQALVFILYFTLSISYLWYNFIGCAACVVFSLVLQAALGPRRETGLPPG